MLSVYEGNAPIGYLCDGGTVKNYGPATVYYADNPNVSSTLYEGSIAPGASVASLDGVQFFFTDSGRAKLSVYPTPPPTPGSLSQLQYFSDRSIWNTPIAGDTKLDGYEVDIAANLDGYVVSTNYPYPIYNTIYEVPHTQELVPVRLVGPDPDWATSVATPLDHLSVFGALTLDPGVPMPSPANPDSNDNSMGFLRRRGPGASDPVDYWELYQTGGDATRIPAEGAPYEGERYTVGGSIIQDIENHHGAPGHEAYAGKSHPKWGNRASGFPYIAGRITIEELWSGTIPHALAFLCWRIRRNWHSHPAVREDVSTVLTITDQHAAMYGDRFFWDAAYDISVEQPTAAPLTRMLVEACQTYGFIPVDVTNNRYGWILEDPYPQYVDAGRGNPYTEVVEGHPPIFRTSDTPNGDPNLTASWTVVDPGAHFSNAWLGAANLHVALRSIQWNGSTTEA